MGPYAPKPKHPWGADPLFSGPKVRNGGESCPSLEIPDKNDYETDLEFWQNKQEKKGSSEEEKKNN